jgi:DNA-binding transcriptional regulator LsrR (DeoR family)
MSERNGHRGIADDEELRRRVVDSVYFHGGVPSCRGIGKVAKELGISPQAVSAILKRAWQLGEFTIHRHGRKEQLAIGRLREAVLARYADFGLRSVALVPGDLEILGDLDLVRRRALRTEVMQEMAAAAAKVLDDHVAAAAARQREDIAAGRTPDTFIIGVAWGRMMHLIARHLHCTARPCHLTDLHVVPIVAPTSAYRQDPVEADLVAMDIARAYGGSSSKLCSPAFVSPEHAEFLRQLPDVRRMLATARNADVLFTGMGAIPANSRAGEIRVSNDPAMNRRILDEALKTPAIGDICGALFGPDGKGVRTSIETIGLGLDDLRAIASDPEADVVLVTGGDRDRFEPLRVALEAGFASRLVTDTVTARYLVGELHVEPPRPEATAAP